MTIPGSASTAMAPVVSAEIFEVESAFVTPYKLSHGTEATTRAVLSKLIDSDGVVGWGEANPKQPFTDESPSDAARALKDTLLLAVFAPMIPEPGAIDKALDALLLKHLCAQGALSMALLDLLGKRLHVPVAMLLGGSLRRSLPVLLAFE